MHLLYRVTVSSNSFISIQSAQLDTRHQQDWSSHRKPRIHIWTDVHCQARCMLTMLCVSMQIYHSMCSACVCCITWDKTPALASNCKFYPVHLSNFYLQSGYQKQWHVCTAFTGQTKLSSSCIRTISSCQHHCDFKVTASPLLLQPVTCDLSLQACADPCCNMGARCCPCCNDLPCTLPASLVNLFQHYSNLLTCILCVHT